MNETMTFDEVIERLRERPGSIRARLDGKAGKLFAGPTGNLQLRYDNRKRWEILGRGATDYLNRLEVKVGNRYQQKVITV